MTSTDPTRVLVLADVVLAAALARRTAARHGHRTTGRPGIDCCDPNTSDQPDTARSNASHRS